MQFLAISKRLDTKFAPTDLAVLAEDEFERGRALYAQGFIRQIWHRADTPGACLLVEAESGQQVREMLSTLPFFQAGILDILVIPLKPYAGFAPRSQHRRIDGDQNDAVRTSALDRHNPPIGV